MLRNYLAQHWRPNPSGLLFPSRKGIHLRWRDNRVKYGLYPILKRLGIPHENVGLHAFRHSLATELAESAVPLPVLQQQMRHADVRTTVQVRSKTLESAHRLRIPRDVPPRNGHCCPHQRPPHADGSPAAPGPPIAIAESIPFFLSGSATTSWLSPSLSLE
jgi:hypothetical protein